MVIRQMRQTTHAACNPKPYITRIPATSMKQSNASWQPRAELSVLRTRNHFYRRIRQFFEDRCVLEVETPILSRGASLERHIESLHTTDDWWLATSPEFAMKRLLAAGSGPIFQIARVFRADEEGRHHNPEFTMLEWYRPGWGIDPLMDEVEALVGDLAEVRQPFERIPYRELVRRELETDPFNASAGEIRDALSKRGVSLPAAVTAEDRDDRDFWLDLAIGAFIGPKLGMDTPVFVQDYPPSQAALARIRPGEEPVAERFELYWRGVELANGFHELTDAGEQKRRFVADQDWRAKRKRIVPPMDENFLAALAAGLPDCAGVALGFDRLVMLALGLPSVAAAMAFDAGRA